MILMNDFKAEPQDLKDASLAAAKRVIDSGWYVLGQELTTFEKQWASICRTGFGVGVGNGMDAIEIALRALNIGPGDEVITSPMTAFASVLAILRSGATPVLADINPDTALLSLESVQRCISSKTKALVLVHLYGQLRDMNSWQELCKASNIYLIEDCAQSHLASWEGKVAGTFGEAGAYSFYPTKNLGALGDAGMLVTNNECVNYHCSI
jgi:dTDP-4-amino-4,6-dideoxygalactose transaminase